MLSIIKTVRIGCNGGKLILHIIYDRQICICDKAKDNYTSFHERVLILIGLNCEATLYWYLKKVLIRRFFYYLL